MLISTPYFNMAFTRVALHDSQLEIILFFLNLIPGVSAAHQFILCLKWSILAPFLFP